MPSRSALRADAGPHLLLRSALDRPVCRCLDDARPLFLACRTSIQIASPSAWAYPGGRATRAHKPCPYKSFSINGHGGLRTPPLQTDDLLGFRQHETPSESTWTTRQHAASRPSGASRTAASERARGTI